MSRALPSRLSRTVLGKVSKVSALALSVQLRHPFSAALSAQARHSLRPPALTRSADLFSLSPRLQLSLILSLGSRLHNPRPHLALHFNFRRTHRLHVPALHNSISWAHSSRLSRSPLDSLNLSRCSLHNLPRSHSGPLLPLLPVLRASRSVACSPSAIDINCRLPVGEHPFPRSVLTLALVALMQGPSRLALLQQQRQQTFSVVLAL